MGYQVNDVVRWNSSNTDKQGTVVAIVPAGQKPSDVGFPKAGGGGLPRDHETYVVKGKKLQHNTVGTIPYGSAAFYWPHVSLLSLVEG